MLDINNLRITERPDTSNEIAMGIKDFGFVPENEKGLTENFRFVLLTPIKAQKVVDELNRLIEKFDKLIVAI